MKRIAVAIWALSLLVAWAALAQDRSVQIYKPKARPAAELVDMAQMALGQEGTATADAGSNSLVLIGTAPAVERALALVRAQDQARQSVTVHWSETDVASLEAAGFRVIWSAGAGGVRVGNVRAREDGVVATARGTKSEVDRSLGGTLRILDGETGRIGQGASVPLTTRSRYGSTTVFAEGERGFEATPRVLGNGKVRVELRPVNAQVGPDGVTRFAAASTVVEVAPGEEVVIGGLGEAGSGSSAGLRGAGAGQALRERVMRLRVDVD